jgi:hypothetical protein
MKLPDFLYIGAPKCASTWIFRTLQAHPQIFVPPAKEIFFFNRQYYRGLEWYSSFFAEAGEKYDCVGELSTSYLYSDEAARRIQTVMPSVKLMACVRNPIARAWSAYLFKKRNGMTPDFKTALATDEKITRWGLYSTHLARYQEMFGHDRFKVFVYDDLKQDPEQFRQSLYRFLNVDLDVKCPVAARKVLPASQPRLFAAAALAKRGARLARRLGLQNLLGRMKSSRVVLGMLYKPFDEGSQEKMPPEVWDRLAAYYAEDIARVSNLLGRDLQYWLNRPASTESGSANGSELRS